MDDDFKREVLTALMAHGVTEATIEFAGGGDSGQIDDISAKGLTEELGKVPAPAGFEQFLEKHCGKPGDPVHAYNSATRTRTTTPRPPHTLYDLIEAFGYECLAAPQAGDWINNDGGFGDICIVPTAGLIEVNMNYTITSSEEAPYDLSIEPLVEDNADG